MRLSSSNAAFASINSGKHNRISEQEDEVPSRPRRGNARQAQDLDRTTNGCASRSPSAFSVYPPLRVSGGASGQEMRKTMHGRTRSSSAHSDVSSGPGTSVQRRGNGGSTSNEAAPSRLPPRSQSMQEARLQSLTGASSGVFRTSSDPADPRPCQNRRRREETFVLSGLSTEPIAAGERLQTSSLLIHLQQGRNRRRRQERVDKWVSEHAGMPRRGQQRSFSDLGMPTLSSTPPELCHKPVPLMPFATSSMTSGLTATSLRCCASVHPDSETYSLAGTDTSKRRTSLLV